MAISAPPLPALRVPGMASRHPVVFRRLVRASPFLPLPRGGDRFSNAARFRAFLRLCSHPARSWSPRPRLRRAVWTSLVCHGLVT
uniref:Predicted protein n=1 Tax=Hordeum vulgare subsp. vulgare TaxID=112509 RepID=F2DXQ0_HORVV|nr:predicted protein [Hordeum vulgare subsp. vulgare]